MSDEKDPDILNLYETIPKKFQEEERHYDNEKDINIKIPFQMCVTGATGSGKTNAVINIFRKINAFDKVMIWAKDTEEPIYASFIDQLREVEKKGGASILSVSNTIADLPDVASINKENTTLLIIDDMVTEKDKALAKVSEYWIRGRKKHVSCMFLSQSYFDIPTIIRKNSFYFIFSKITGDGDLARILKDYKLGINDEQLLKLYETATKSGFPNFFMIDVKTSDKALRFRRNLRGLPPPEGTTEKAQFNAAGEPLGKKGGLPPQRPGGPITSGGPSASRPTAKVSSSEASQKRQLEEIAEENIRKKKNKKDQDDMEANMLEGYKKFKEDRRKEKSKHPFNQPEKMEFYDKEEEKKELDKLIQEEYKRQEAEQRKLREMDPFHKPEKMEKEDNTDYLYDWMDTGSGIGRRTKKKRAPKKKKGGSVDSEILALVKLLR